MREDRDAGIDPLFAAGLLLTVLVAVGLVVAHRPQPRPVYQCDANGRFVIGDDLSNAEALELLNRNVDLTSLRVRAMTGEQWIDRAQLVKAKGCP